MPQRLRCAPALTYLTRPKTRVLNPFHKRHSQRAAQRSYAGVRMSSQIEDEGRSLCQSHQVRSEVMRRPSTAPEIDPGKYRAGVETIGFTKSLLEGGGFHKTMTAPTDAVVHAEWSPSPRRPPAELYATSSSDHHQAWCGARLLLILTKPFDAGLQNACALDLRLTDCPNCEERRPWVWGVVRSAVTCRGAEMFGFGLFDAHEPS
jgi:hypothetical protein